MSTKLNRFVAWMLTLCMALCCVPAFAEGDIELLEESLLAVTGVTSGDLAAKGQFYADYTSLKEELEAGNRVHEQMVAEGQVLLKNEK